MTEIQIIEAVKALPIKERLKVIGKLNQAAIVDADLYSSGRPDNTEAYDKLLDTTNHDAIQAAKNAGKDMSAETHVSAGSDNGKPEVIKMHNENKE